MWEKICCVTGHRDISADKMEYVARQLEQEVELAIQEGYTHFISGFARGADLLFAQAVAAQKDKGAKLVLEAAIPYRGRLYSREEGFQRLLGRCDRITVVSEEYFPGCYMRRNRYMVDKARRVVAVYDGRKVGGTGATVAYAQKMSRQLRVIWL